MIVPGQYDFDVWAGADFDTQFQLLDAAGSPVDFTGYTPRFVAKVKISDSVAAIDFSGSPNLVFDVNWWLTLKIPADLTSPISACCLNYSISLVNDTDADDIIAYADGVINLIKRADPGV